MNLKDLGLKDNWLSIWEETAHLQVKKLKTAKKNYLLENSPKLMKELKQTYEDSLRSCSSLLEDYFDTRFPESKGGSSHDV